jgi:hypothetical protein
MIVMDIDLLPVGLVPKYFGSEWSYAQVRGLEGKCICAFDRDSQKITVSILFIIVIMMVNFSNTYIGCVC